MQFVPFERIVGTVSRPAHPTGSIFWANPLNFRETDSGIFPSLPLRHTPVLAHHGTFATTCVLSIPPSGDEKRVSSAIVLIPRR